MSVPQISEAEIEAALQPFGQSRTLPAAAYVSEEVLEWEREHFYASGWTCVGRASDVAEGSYRAVTAGNDSLLLSRGPGGELKAFFNVCRHRCHELLPCGSSAAAKVIKCPYHGWTYGLDGALKAAPHFGDQPDFDAGDYPLIEARAHEWGGWVFVNVSGEAPDFDAYTGSLRQTIAPYHPEQLVIAARDEYVVNANWKSIIENYHECYHCNHIHPELVQVSSPDSGRTWYPDGAWVGGDMELLEGMKTMSMDGQTGAHKMLPGLEGKQLRDVLYFELFPNLLISPHPDYILTHRFEPLEPGLTKVECHWLFDVEEVAREDFDPSYAVDFWDITNKQDWSATEGVQQGMNSKGYTSGPYRASRRPCTRRSTWWRRATSTAASTSTTSPNRRRSLPAPTTKRTPKRGLCGSRSVSGQRLRPRLYGNGQLPYPDQPQERRRHGASKNDLYAGIVDG